MSLSGDAVLRNVSATVSWTGLETGVTIVFETLSIQKSFDVEEIAPNGTITAMAANNLKYVVTGNGIIKGGTLAQSKTLTQPTELATITLASSSHTELDGTYNNTGTSISLNGGAKAQISLNMVQVGGAALALAT
tara:strand:- start:1 stop:405 length:405 start_codon:yes stop_codon:yes gene_type:complete